MTNPKPVRNNICQRCKHKWIPRTNTILCPKCHSVYWRVKRKPTNYGRKSIRMEEFNDKSEGEFSSNNESAAI